MNYAIIGFGKIGQALARAFARKNINVTVASRRPPEALAPQARAIGPTVVAKSLRHALEADTIILAIPFGEHREVAKALPSWEGKTVIDATNAFGVLPEELGGLPSSAVIAKAFTGATAELRHAAAWCGNAWSGLRRGSRRTFRPSKRRLTDDRRKSLFYWKGRDSNPRAVPVGSASY